MSITAASRVAVFMAASEALASDDGFNGTGAAVALLWARSKVYLHPSAYLKDNIAGWLVLCRKEDRQIEIIWIEETVVEQAGLSHLLQDVELHPVRDRSGHHTQEFVAPLHTLRGNMHVLPLSSLASLTIRVPTLASWYGSVTLHMRGNRREDKTLFFHDEESYTVAYIMSREGDNLGSSSVTFPPPSHERFKTIKWGGDVFLMQLKRYSDVFKSLFEPSLYLVNASTAERATHSTATYPDNALDTPPDYPHPFSIASLQTMTTPRNFSKMSVMSAFSRVTIGARQAAASFLEMPIVRQQVIPNLPRTLVEPVVNTLHADIQFGSPVTKITDEYNPARVYLATWAAMMSDEAEKTKRSQKHSSLGATASVGETSRLDGSVFELMTRDPACTRARGRKSPLTMEEWEQCFDAEGRLSISEEEMTSRLGASSMVNEVRPQAWLFLLAIVPWKSSSKERDLIISTLKGEYTLAKDAWKKSEEERNSDHFRDQRHKIEKDVSRLDRSVAGFAAADFPNPDPNALNPMTNATLETLKDVLTTHCLHDINSLGPKGYVQGMSDLIAPLWVIYKDEALTYLTYGRLMARLDQNFREDQSGMRKQLAMLEQLIALMDPELHTLFEKAHALHLFFAFRWLLLLFKREMMRPVSETHAAFEDVFVTWETIFAFEGLTKEYHLFIALAILENNRHVILDHLREFDEILQFINGLAGTMDLEGILIRAEELFWRFKVMLDTVREQEAREAESRDQDTNLAKLRQRRAQAGKSALSSAIELPRISPLLRDIC